MTSSSGPVPVVDGRREGAVSTRYELRPAHEDTGGDARDRELEPWKPAISGQKVFRSVVPGRKSGR